MLETREKAEIRTSVVVLDESVHLRSPLPQPEALSSFGFQYLSETYLPLKLQEVRVCWTTEGHGSADCTLRYLAGRLDLDGRACEIPRLDTRPYASSGLECVTHCPPRVVEHTRE